MADYIASSGMLRHSIMRKNSIFKNTAVAYREMFRRYPASIFVLLLHIVVRIILPITNTFIPAVAIKGITSENLKTFFFPYYRRTACSYGSKYSYRTYYRLFAGL